MSSERWDVLDAPQADPDSTPRRLHPSTLLFSLLGYAKGLIIPIVVVLFLTSEDSWELWFGLLIVPAMMFEAWRYLTYRYRFEDEELIITQGVLFKGERHIPLARIQNIDSTQSFLQRLFGVAEARIETASGSEAEAELKVLSTRMLEELRARVFRDAGGASTEAGSPASGPEVLFQVQRRDLLLLGLDPARGLAIIGVGLGVMWEFDLWDRIDVVRPVRAAIVRHLFAAELVQLTAWIAALVLAALGALFVLSLLATVVKLYGFRLERSDNGFRVHAGLFTHVATTVNRKRIQFLSIEAPPLLRMFDRVTVKIETAGGKEEGEEQSATRQWLLPVVRRERLPELLREIEPDLDLAALSWNPLAQGALARLRKRHLLGALLLSLVAMLPFGAWGLFSALLFLPLAFVTARASVRRARWTRSPYGVLYRHGLVTPRVDLTFLGRIQVLALHESPFDRRHAMASLAVDTAGAGKIGSRIDIPYLERSVAADLQRDLFAAAEHNPLVSA